MDPVIGVLLGLLPAVPAFMLGLSFGRSKAEAEAKLLQPVPGQLWVLQGVGTVMVKSCDGWTVVYRVVDPMVPNWKATGPGGASVPAFMACGALLKQPPALTEVLESAKEVV